MGTKLTLKKLRELAQEIAHDTALAKADEEHRRRLEKFGSIELEESLVVDSERAVSTHPTAEPTEQGCTRSRER